MATLLSRIETALGDADFDIDDAPDGSNDADVIAYQEKLQTLLDKFANIGCMVGCLPEYLQCKKDNPSYPGQSICDAYLSQCVANCNQS